MVVLVPMPSTEFVCTSQLLLQFLCFLPIPLDFLKVLLHFVNLLYFLLVFRVLLFLLFLLVLLKGEALLFPLTLPLCLRFCPFFDLFVLTIATLWELWVVYHEWRKTFLALYYFWPAFYVISFAAFEVRWCHGKSRLCVNVVVNVCFTSLIPWYVNLLLLVLLREYYLVVECRCKPLIVSHFFKVIWFIFHIRFWYLDSACLLITVRCKWPFSLNVSSSIRQKISSGSRCIIIGVWEAQIIVRHFYCTLSFSWPSFFP